MAGRRLPGAVRAGATLVGLTVAAFVAMFIVAGPANACRTSCGGEGTFHGSMLVTEKGKTYSPGSGGNGGGGDSDTLWSLRDMCEITNENGLCHGAPLKCEAPDEDETIQSVRYMSEDQGWVSTGGWCPQDGKLHSVDEVAEQVRADWEQSLPKLKPTMQPDKRLRTLVNFPTYFQSGQDPNQVLPTFETDLPSIWGLDLHLSAKPTWYWDFDGKGEKEFHITGSTYKDKGPLHYTYKELGKESPSVRATWQGELTINGEGPFEIETPATQQAVALPIEVVEKVDVLSGK